MVNYTRPNIGIKVLLKFISIGVFIVSCQGVKDLEPVTIPTVLTGQVSEVTANSATVTGQVLDDGNGLIIERGMAFGKEAGPTITGFKVQAGTGVGAFSAGLTGLDLNTKYYCRAYASNSAGVAYGMEITFLTGPGTPKLTATIGSITSPFSAILGGKVESDQGSIIIKRGVCYGLKNSPAVSGPKPKISGEIGEFQSEVTGLTPNTRYYIRAYAINSVGTEYGPEISIDTPDNKVLDVDGNQYTYVKIGTQYWFEQDLKTTKYRNGDFIPEVSDNSAWSNLLTGGYCFYDNNASNNTIYGKLYNWYAVSDSRGVCPSGWHTPTEADWIALVTYAGGPSQAGAKLKSIANWAAPNAGATNETSFGAVPGGYRRTAGGFERKSLDYWCWTSTDYSLDKACDFAVDYLSPTVTLGQYPGNEKKYGNSARCIKD